jgi:exosortase
LIVSESDTPVILGASEGGGPVGSAGAVDVRQVLADPATWLLAALVAGVLWGLWPNLVSMERKWLHDPRYSHGMLVPVFALVLAYMRVAQFSGRARGANWGGVLLVLAGVATQLVGAFLFYEWIETLSLLPYIAGLVVLWGGSSCLRWAWAPIAFLVFMVPLPYRVETALGWPLQRLATVSSTFLLQTLGLTAGAEGNTIVLEGGRIGVVEACNGLGILFTFLATASAVALIVDRPVWQKWLVVLSAVPIALVANITRITATGFLHETVGGPTADMVYHDLAGWLMMPFALVMLWAELAFFSLLVVDFEEAPAASVTEATAVFQGEPSC